MAVLLLACVLRPCLPVLQLALLHFVSLGNCGAGNARPANGRHAELLSLRQNLQQAAPQLQTISLYLYLSIPTQLLLCPDYYQQLNKVLRTQLQ